VIQRTQGLAVVHITDSSMGAGLLDGPGIDGAVWQHSMIHNDRRTVPLWTCFTVNLKALKAGRDGLRGSESAHVCESAGYELASER